MFEFSWLKSFVRKNTKPIPVDRATYWQRRISFAYAIIAWNAFGFVAYMIYSGKGDWAAYYGYKSKEQQALTPAQQWSRTLGIKDATVLKVSGLKASKYEIHNDFDQENASNNDEINVDSTEIKADIK